MKIKDNWKRLVRVQREIKSLVVKYTKSFNGAMKARKKQHHCTNTLHDEGQREALIVAKAMPTTEKIYADIFHAYII